MSLSHVLTNTKICIFSDNGESIEVLRSSPTFANVVNLLNSGASYNEIAQEATIKNKIESTSNITIDNVKIYFNGKELNNAVTEAILNYVANGLKIDSIVKFLERLMQNPSKNSIDQLWRFIEHHSLPLTADGKLLAYKVVRNDYYDKHSGKILNSIGSVIQMPRNEIDDDPNKHCSAGLHVGGLAYSGPNGWYSSDKDICLIVEVDPKDVVCVPHDHNSTKIRVCEYKVVKKYCDVLKTTVYDENYEEVDGEIYEYEDDSINIGDMVISDCGFVGEVIDEHGAVFLVKDPLTRRCKMIAYDKLSKYEE